MLAFLAHEETEGTTVIRMDRNHGHNVVYSQVDTPARFVITDPDLIFHADMPSDVIDHLVKIADIQKCQNVGLALHLPKEGLKIIPNYIEGQSLTEWERKFWLRPVNNSAYELYFAETDTTFKLVTKMYNNDNNVRVAGIFACRHIPWYEVPEVTVPADEQEWYKRTQTCSTITQADVK